jgi:hypothetical protein
MSGVRAIFLLYVVIIVGGLAVYTAVGLSHH